MLTHTVLFRTETKILGRTKEVLCALVLGTSLGTKSCAGLGTESWKERSLVTKSWCESFEGGGEQESFAKFWLESYVGLGKVLCGVLCGLTGRQKVSGPPSKAFHGWVYGAAEVISYQATDPQKLQCVEVLVMLW